MRRRSTFSLQALRRFAGPAALLALVFALIPRGYMPAVAQAGSGRAETFAFVICHGAGEAAFDTLSQPTAPGKPPSAPAHGPDAGDCPFAPVSGALVVFATPPVLAVRLARHLDAPPPRHWNAPGLPFFPRPFGARAPPVSRA